jgi:predicted transcriptional regulator
MRSLICANLTSRKEPRHNGLLDSDLGQDWGLDAFSCSLLGRDRLGAYALAGQSAAIDLEFQAAGTAQVRGPGNSTIHATGLVMRADVFASLDFTGEFRILQKKSPALNFETQHISGPGDIPIGEQPAQDFTAEAGSILPRANATVIVVPRELSATLAIPCLRSNLDLDLPRLSEASYHAVYERPIQPLGSTFRATCQGAPLEIEGDLLILIYNSLVTAPGKKVETGSHRNAGFEDSLLTAESSDDFYAVIVGTGRLEPVAQDDWAVFADSVDGSVKGSFAASGIRIASSSPPLPESFSLLEVTGDLTYALGRENWKLQGDATDVRFDGKSVSPEESSAVKVVTTLGIFGAVALLIRLLIAGYNRTTPLANETRRGLLEIIRHNPGTSVSQLCTQLGVRRPTVYFHANILVRAGMLTMQRRGKSWHLAPPTIRLTELERAAAVQHPIRRVIHEILDSQSNSPAADLMRSMAARGLAVSSSMMAYHLRIMLAEGIVTKERQAGRVVYALREEAIKASMSKPGLFAPAMREA